MKTLKNQALILAKFFRMLLKMMKHGNNFIVNLNIGKLRNFECGNLRTHIAENVLIFAL